MTFTAEELIQRHDRLKADRGTWESHWEELAEYISPRKLGFTGLRSPGEKRMTRVYDPAGIYANETLAAGLHGMATNPASKWFSLRMIEDDLNENEEVKEYLAEVERRMFSAMMAPGAGITSHLHELYLDLGAFGTAVLFTGMTGKGRLLFQARSLAECVVDENAEGMVDTLFRKFTYSVRRAVQQFGWDDVSPGVRDKYTQNKLDDNVSILHAVYPREDRGSELKDVKSMLFASCYYECDAKHLLKESGFEEFPFAVPRWYRQAGEIYGRSPGMTALPDVKMLQEMAKTTIKAAQKIVDPPLLVPDDGVVGPVRTVPGGLNFYRGQRKIEPLGTGGNIPLAEQLMEGIRNRILTTMFADQLSLPSGRQMTAEEVIKRTQERMRLLGPILGRMEQELLGPLITRVFGLMSRVKGMLPEAPEAIQDKEFTVEYVSPLARAQRQSEVDGLVQMFNIVLPLAEAKPKILDRIDEDRIVPWLSDRFAVDPALIKSDDAAEVDDANAGVANAMPVLREGAAAAKDGAGAMKAASEAGIDPAMLAGLLANGGAPQ